MAASWLKDAVFYEIYPQSFYDSNGDGIGDLQGMALKLDYVRSIGCNAIWMNPCFDSPFKDAGYDVRDYYKVAPRYGTNEDLKNLFAIAHEKGLKILLDLVPGHTSEENEWFKKSCEEDPDFAQRYIWTDGAFSGGDGMPFIGGEYPRNATYIINFFKCQPALNYGYRDRHTHWQQSIDAPGPMANREAMKDIMRFWLDMGCDGFRVDMADSLVKNDHGVKTATMEVWKDMAGAIHAQYPEAVLISEWNHPDQALACGFDGDFYLNWDGNGYSLLFRDYRRDAKGNVTPDNSYFKAESTQDIQGFLGDYLPKYQASKDLGLWCLITGNHDTPRLAPSLDDRERRLAFAFLLTMPGAPFIYYGDEIGMDYRWLPSKEGGYARTGSRTPMQWCKGKNLGFSDCDAPYLPTDDRQGAPTVESQNADPDSLLNHVRRLIALRKNYADLGNYSDFQVYSAREGERLFAYKRGKLLCALNPGVKEESCKLDGQYRVVYALGEGRLEKDQLIVGRQSFTVLAPAE